MPRIPEHGRLLAAVLCGGGVIYLVPVFFGPMFCFLGAAGMVEPKIVWSVGKYGKHLPVHFKVIGVALAVLGLAVSAFLALRVYHLF